MIPTWQRAPAPAQSSQQDHEYEPSSADHDSEQQEKAPASAPSPTPDQEDEPPVADQMYGEKKNKRGQHNVVPISDWRKQSYLQWLCTPPKEREHKSEVSFGKSIGQTDRTLRNWKNDKEFLDAWEKLYLKTIGNPARKSEIMDTLYKTATDPDDPKHVQAAKQYFEIEGSVKPAQMEVNVKREAAALTDEELQQLIAIKAGDELSARRASNGD